MSRNGDQRSTIVRRLAVALILALAVTTLPAPSAPAQSESGWLGKGDYQDVGGDYDPDDDPGSLRNVARTIRLDDDDPTGDGVDIALIDTGIVEVDALRESSVVFGPDFSFEDTEPALRSLDTNGHGTHLAGIIVGTSAERDDDDDDEAIGGVAGLAPDARLLSIKVGAANGSADVTQVIAAINWVIDNKNANGWNIRVINLAYGTDAGQDYAADPLAHAVERAWRAGIVVVVAAGNDGAAGLRNPASDPYVITVGAGYYERGRHVAIDDFSSQGSIDRALDLVAPGRSIVSACNPGSYAHAAIPQCATDRVVRGTGTSQAAAVVTAAVAVLLEDRPSLTPDQVKGILVASARGKGQVGMLDVDEALDTKAPKRGQSHAPSTGTGSIAAARGSVVLSSDGVAIGETDIFGRSWADSAWALDSWSTNTWLGTAWADNVWADVSWSGRPWSELAWSGNEWTGNEWSGSGWLGNEWSKQAWSASTWTSLGGEQP